MALGDKLWHLDVRTPLRACDDFLGVVLDADGDEVFVVNPHSDVWSDIDAFRIAELLAAAINAGVGR